jgi:hypothetical protein
MPPPVSCDQLSGQVALIESRAARAELCSTPARNFFPVWEPRNHGGGLHKLLQRAFRRLCVGVSRVVYFTLSLSPTFTPPRRLC